MKRNWKSFSIGIALSIAYIFIIGYYIFNLVNLPEQYRIFETKVVDKVETEVSRYVDEYAVTKANQFEVLVDKYPLDLLVLEDGNPVYKSSSALDTDNFFEFTSKKAILYESKGTMHSHDSNYQFFVRLYRLPEDSYLMPFLTKLLIILGLSFIVITCAFIFIMNSLLKPMRKAKKSLEHLQNYEFDQIDSSDDVINQRLSNVSSQIDNAMTQASHRYTDFEKDLEISRQRLNNAMVVSRSFVHDLKTPVHQQIMMNELVSDSPDEKDTPESIANMNMKQSTKLMKRINEILKVLNQDNLTLENNLSEFDLVAMTYTTLQFFGKTFAKRGLQIEVDVPDVLMIQSNSVILQLLIHNLMSNIGHYALEDSTVKITINSSEATTEMIYENVSSPTNLDRMKKSEFLFNVLNEDKEHEHSSGNGLFLIKDLANLAKGSYSLKTRENTVSISIKLPNETGECNEKII